MRAWMTQRSGRCSCGIGSTPAAIKTSLTRSTTTTPFLSFPQSGERFVGVENFREWRRLYPASLAFEIREIRGRDDLWVAENLISYDQGPWNFTVNILEFRGAKVARESIYITEGWEAPEWRAPWRDAP
jgi:hypothetical protein